MRRLITMLPFVFFLLSVQTANATDLNCPAGGEPDLDEIINEMMDIAPEEITFYEGVSISSCSDLGSYEIVCTNNGSWRERNGYLSVTAKYAGHAQELFWEHDITTDGHIFSAAGGNQEVELVNLFLTAEELLFYFKLEDVTSGDFWFSLDSLNDDGYRHMVTYRLGNDVFVCGFEDLALPGGDGDYQDLVFMITHSAPDCIPAIESIPDQSVPARGSFDPINLDEYVLDGEYDKASIIWTWTGPPGGNISVSFGQDPDDHWIATITYPNDWTGQETISFTATVNSQSFESEPVSFQVAEPDAPVVHDIPDQVVKSRWPFQQVHLDQYVDPPPNYQDSDVDWTWENLTGSHISVTIENRVATITYDPANWTGSEQIRYTGTINPSGSSVATYTVVSGGLAVGGVASVANKAELLAPWITLAALVLLSVSAVAIRQFWRKFQK